jgi:hypothetical protein
MLPEAHDFSWTWDLVLVYGANYRLVKRVLMASSCLRKYG